MTPTLCLVTTCMGRLAHLRESLPAAAAQPGAGCVLVDYSCPELCGEWAEANCPGVRVVRVPGRDRWNPCAARNAGAAAADAEWLAFLDADVVPSPGFAAAVAAAVTPGRFYRADPACRDLTGTFVCRRADFDRAGGFDEAVRGWGMEDKDLYARLRMAGLVPDVLPPGLVRSIPHGDELRTQFHDEKNPAVSDVVNAFYVRMKHDLMRATGGELPLATRERLHAMAARWVGGRLAGDGPGEVRMAFRTEHLPGVGEVEASFAYRVVRPAPPG